MNKFALANARRVNVAYSPDVTKATAVKTVKKLSVITTHQGIFQKVVNFLHLKIICILKKYN